MIKINYKSDFKIKEKPTTVALEVPFIFSYYVFENKKYVASFDGSKYVNCERNEDGSLDVIFNNPGFGIGHLKVERKYAIKDKAFSDGVYDVVSEDKTEVFITSGETSVNYVETLVVPPYLKGDKGDAMTWKTMTDGERKELVEDVVEAIGIDFEHTGDGTKFLSNDGTYKEIEASKYDDAELRNKIEENAKNIADNKTNVDKELSNLVTKSELESTDAKANRAISEASVAKNAVATLEGLANADEAMQTLASQVVQIEENKQKISELGSEVNDVNKVIYGSEYVSEYNVVVGGNYDWKLAVDVDINKGEEFAILVETDTTTNPLYFGFIEKGSTAKQNYNEYVMPNVEKTFVATHDIKTFFIPYSLNPLKDGNFKISVKLADSLKEEVEDLYKEVDRVKTKVNPMNGKTFYSIGDSHRWKWLNKLAEITDSISGGDIFSHAIDTYEKYYVSRTVAMAKYIADLYKSGKPVDYIFLEYTHKYFTNTVAPSNMFYYSGDITEAEPFLTQAYYDFTDQVFDNSVKAKEYWDANFQSIVGRYTPKSNAIIALKTGVKVQQPKFKLSGSATNSGNFTIKFTGRDGITKQMSIAIPSGLEINDALTIVNEIEFADSGSLWDNLSAHNSVNDATLKFTYKGSSSDADSNMKLTFDFGTTGIVHDGDWGIVTEISDWIRGFRSHDVSKWTNTDKWNELYANFDAYIWIKAAVELLQREVPTAKIFVWTLCTEAWNYANNTIGGKSVLYPDGMLNVQAIYDSEEHKRMVQNVEGWEKVAKYYHLGFIPIFEMNSISPVNHKYYYASDDVHPTQEAYDRVAEILAANVY